MEPAFATGSAGLLSRDAVWSVWSDVAGEYLGSRVGSAGDVNGDGFDDVLLTVAGFGGDWAYEGQVRLYLGSGSGPSVDPDWTVAGGQRDAYLSAADGAGDVNGDGFDDVVVGASGYDDGETDEGRVLLFLGSSEGLTPTPASILQSDVAGARFGDVVAGAGDVNADGFADVIVGSALFEVAETKEGRAWVFLGSPGGLEQDPVWTGSEQGTGYGERVAAAGDVNGDGYDDVLVTQSNGGLAGSGQGTVFLYPGSSEGPTAEPTWTEVGQAHVSFGRGLSSAGDVNGDGYDDVVIGAPDFSTDDAQRWEGFAAVYYGSRAGLSLEPAWRIESDVQYANFGSAVASVGDVNRDGFGDVLVGAYGFPDTVPTGHGKAFLYLGSAAGLPAEANWTQLGEAALGKFGVSVASAGDVDGDGFDDALVGASNYDSGQGGGGRVFLYYGNCSYSDADQDGQGDTCDNCPQVGNADQADADGDGLGDACDRCRNDPDNDADGDGVCGELDTCPWTAGADQSDDDGDGLGNICDDCPNDPDNDVDGDGICAPADVCPAVADPKQADADGDGVGDACDTCAYGPAELCEGGGPSHYNAGGCASARGAVGGLGALLAVLGLALARRRRRPVLVGLLSVVAVLTAPSKLAASEAAPGEVRKMAFLGVTQLRGYEAEEGASLASLMQVYLRRGRGLDVIGEAELQTLLGLEAKKQLFGCESSASCLAEVGGALGAGWAAYAEVARIGSSSLVRLTVIDVEKARVIAEAMQQVSSDGSVERLTERVPALVYEVLDALGRAPVGGVSGLAGRSDRGAWLAMRLDGDLTGLGYAPSFQVGYDLDVFAASVGAVVAQPLGLRAELRLAPWRLGPTRPYAGFGATWWLGDLAGRAVLGAQARFGSLRVFADLAYEHLLVRHPGFRQSSVLLGAGVGWGF